MTLDELEALRDVSPSFGYVEKIIDGRKMRVAVLQGECGVLFQGDDDGVVTDADGNDWIVGWKGDERVRRRMS